MPIHSRSPNVKKWPGPFADPGPSTSPFERDWARMYLALKSFHSEQSLRVINDLECGKESAEQTIKKCFDYARASKGKFP